MSAAGIRIRIQPEQMQAVRRVAVEAGVSESRAVALMIAIADAELTGVGDKYAVMAGGVLRVAETGNQRPAATTKSTDKSPKAIRATKPQTADDQRQAATTKPADKTPKTMRAAKQPTEVKERQVATTKPADKTPAQSAPAKQYQQAALSVNDTGTDEWADLDDDQRDLLRHAAFILNEDREVALREAAPDGMSQYDWNMLSNTYLPGDDGSMFFHFTWTSQEAS